MICTGGTTGRPKGVLWRQSDIYVSSMVGADHESAQEIHDKVRAGGPPWFAVSPLMHAAGMWTAFSAIMAGTPVVLYDTGKKLDPRSVWETAEREKVGLMTMVGDAYAAPLVAELRRGQYDLSSLYGIGTGGAATNLKYQRALLELLPQITLINGYGSSETGNMGFGRSHGDTRTDTFTLREGGLVLSEDYSHFLAPGEQEVGWAAREGRIPLGYFNDPDATRKTFPEVAGKRVVISGDRAGWNQTAPCGCSAATRWWSTPAAKRCSSKKSKRCCAPTRRSPTLWWWAARVNAGAKNWSPSSKCAQDMRAPTPVTSRCTHIARRSWRGSRRPRSSSSSTTSSAWATVRRTTAGRSAWPWTIL
jgi:acyl-CoA synthetase (AMP-forming)/AMP-acid ligase II